VLLDKASGSSQQPTKSRVGPRKYEIDGLAGTVVNHPAGAEAFLHGLEQIAERRFVANGGTKSGLHLPDQNADKNANYHENHDVSGGGIVDCEAIPRFDEKVVRTGGTQGAGCQSLSTARKSSRHDDRQNERQVRRVRPDPGFEDIPKAGGD
jgi:hypothetical protein